MMSTFSHVPAHFTFPRIFSMIHEYSDSGQEPDAKTLQFHSGLAKFSAF